MATLRDLPYIPLEVGENIIDQCSGHVDALRSCALTCRGWNRHARYHLMAAICIRSREDLYSICNYFASNSRMASLVRSLSMSPAAKENRRCLLEVLPVDMLKRLPNLQRYRIVGQDWPDSNRVSFHATVLIHIKTYLHVEDLYLNRLTFRTSAELARVLIALPQLRRLECVKLKVDLKTTDTSRFSDKCNMLSEVTAPMETDVDIIPLIVQMSLSTLRVLRCDLRALIEHVNANHADLSGLKNLHSLEIMAYDSIKTSFDQIVPVIATLTSNKLRDLTISFCDFRDGRTNLVGHPLEDAILTLGTPSVVFSIPLAKHNRLGFYSKTFQTYFPRLHEGELLRVQCSSGYPDGEIHLGHDMQVTAMAASPDSRYIVTGGYDGTVIIWSGATFPQKMLLEIRHPAEFDSVLSLQFSDTSDLLAGICDQNILIWRVIDGVQVTSISGTGRQRSCAWLRQSLTLSVVDWGPHEAPSASLSVTKVHVLHSGTVTTSEPVPLLPNHLPTPIPYHKTIENSLGITQSSSGLWVAVWNTAAPGCYVWQLVDSTPAYVTHRLSYGHPHSEPSCAIFVGDTQLVIGFEDGSIRWWDISLSPLTTEEPRGLLSLFYNGSAVTSLSMSRLHSFLVAWSSKDESVSVLRLTKTRTTHGHLADFSLHVILWHGHTNWITAACISPCERYVATASNDSTVRLWSTRDGELLWTSRYHHLYVTHVLFSPDGRILTWADLGGRVCIHLLSMYVRDVPVSSVDDP